MAQITIDVDEDELARARALAAAEGLSVEDWLHVLIERGAIPAPPVRPHSPLFGMVANEPELADAIDRVVAARQSSETKVAREAANQGSIIGARADEPELADAVDEVVAERSQHRLRES